MAIWSDLWDKNLWAGHNVRQNRHGFANDGSSILHYILFFRADAKNLDNFFESRFKWSPDVDKDTKKKCLDSISKIKEDVAKNGLILTAEMSNCMKEGGQAELHLKIPYSTKRDDSHCWNLDKVYEIVKEQSTSIQFLMVGSGEDKDKKVTGLVYTLSRYGAILYYLNKGCFYNQGSFLGNRDIYISFFVMPTGEKDSLVVISYEELDYRKVWLYYESRFREYKNTQVLTASVKSAIGSIMSRNGSHNIGSHVLAALSHNVGTMPDDRVLYQYIQHRMDYIATATTDFPIWKQPLLFVANMMKSFLIQRHLLDYITRSEGLSAYQFQNESVDCQTHDKKGKIGCQPHSIRIHIRRISDSEKHWDEAHYFCPSAEPIDFIDYPTGDGISHMKEDVEVAIPGGVVGQHAFYTIVENVLRNAAKHEWAKLSDGDKEKGRLEVIVDFKDNPTKGIVECVVWTDNIYTARKKYRKLHLLTPDEIRFYIKEEQSGRKTKIDKLEDYQKLQVNIARSFISVEDGRLRKENWGLAEMRISAGYLNTADIEDIGGLRDTDARMEIIKPVLVKSKDHGIHYCLGYHFDIPKPREILVVVPNDMLDQGCVTQLHKVLMKHGVGMLSEAEVEEESRLNKRSSKLAYSFVLIHAFQPKMKSWRIPFRVLVHDTSKESLMLLTPKHNTKIRRCARYVPDDSDDVYENIILWAKEMMAGKLDIGSVAHKIKSGIYRSWLRHLKEQRFDNNARKNIPLVLDVKKESKGGKDLISDIDLLKVVFENCFNKAVSSFIDAMTATIDGDVRQALNEMKCMSPRVVYDIATKKGNRTLFVEDMIYEQLERWCVDIRNTYRKKKATCPDAVLFVQDVLEAKNQGKDVVFPTGLEEFVRYLKDTILVQAKVFLSRYEESYVTLPKSLLADNTSPSGGKIGLLDDQEVVFASEESTKKEYLTKGLAQGILESVKTKKASRQRMKKNKEKSQESEVKISDVIAYWRHENFEANREVATNVFCTPRYLEPLSGAQSYLSSFESLSNLDDIQAARFALKLIENGLMRVLIIDERVKRFVEEHSEVATTFRHIGLSVFDHDDQVTRNIFAKSKNHKLKTILIDDIDGTKIKVADFDLLIIHQGIIDKLLKGHDSSVVVGRFIEDLKKEIRYVVITTGRGSPANIPSDARVVPFSVIESALFKKYPEKLLLVDAVMNVLPLGRKES